MTRPPLTRQQKKLLAEIEEAGVLYVRRWGPYYKTATALVNKKYAVLSEPDYTRNGRDGYSVRPDFGLT